jgi:LacI family transcriptional regulator
MLPVPVTVVRHSPEDMGRLAAEVAYARLAGEDELPRRHVLGCQLVPRGSGEVAP